MIDTNTVNFAFGKIGEAITNITPSVTAITKELVEYVVFKTYVDLAVCFVLLLVSLFGIYLFSKLLSNEKQRNQKSGMYVREGFEFGYTFGIIGTSAASVVLFIAVGCGIYSSVLATNYPKMYTIEHVIDKMNRD